MNAADRLADYFRHRPGEWIPSIDLMPIGGLCSWRTRVAELRRAPYDMRIENDASEVVVRPDGSWARFSKYRFVL